jgi:hypothetical protein
LGSAFSQGNHTVSGGSHCEAEIGNLYIEVFVKQNVIMLDVKMKEAIAVHVIETLDELTEPKARNPFIKTIWSFVKSEDQ